MAAVQQRDPATPAGPARRDIVEWDVAAWGQVFGFWQRCCGALSGLRVLEIGGKHGGLSLYFALKGCRVVCSDLQPDPQARNLHEKYGLADQVTYAAVDATAISYPDNTFDIICFKSVIGALRQFDLQEKAIREMHRVLVPGGRLLFAENMAGSPLHTFCRRHFVPWGQYWRYLSPVELEESLAGFRQVRLDYRGVLTAFGLREWQRNILHLMDRVIEPLLPDRFKYIAFGCATK